MNPFLSVIIPVYNSEDYLKACLDSIISQIAQDIEIVLIDDGSEDDSLQIMNNYQKSYDFIKVYTQKNKGQGSARNKGINNSKGEYVWFVDSDDWITEGAFDSLKNALMSSPEVLIFKYKLGIQTDEEDFLFENNKGFDEKFIFSDYSSEEIFKYFLNGKIQPLCSNKVYSRTLFSGDQCRFEEGIFFEDFVHNTVTLSLSKSTKILNEELYVYAKREKSTMTSQCSDKHINSIFHALSVIKLLLKKQNKYENLKPLFVKLFWFHLTFVFFEFVSKSGHEHHAIFLSKLDDETSKLDDDFYRPVKFDHINKKIFPFATLISLMFDNNMIRTTATDISNITNAFNLPFLKQV